MELKLNARALRRAAAVALVTAVVGALAATLGYRLGKPREAGQVGGAVQAVVAPPAATPDSDEAAAENAKSDDGDTPVGAASGDAAAIEAARRVLEGEFTGYHQRVELPAGEVRDFELVAAEAEITILEGVATRVWAYNGLVPGPELRVTLGDTVRVRFENRLPAETTIHWHGVRVPNAMDGVPGVTQPPIESGGTFVYEFTPQDPGTFWFHPHVRASEEVERGLYGVLVVEDPAEPAYDRDVVWVLDDWLLTEDGQVFPQFNTGSDLMHDGRWGNVVTVNGRVDETLEAKAGERLRLRLVNPSNGRVYLPDFSGLDAKVIAYDGILVERPFAPEMLELAPGNRIDLDVIVPPERKGTTLVVYDRATRQPVPLAQIAVAEEVVETPGFAPPANESFPRWTEADGVPVDHVLELAAAQGGQFGLQWTINGRAYPASAPLPLDYGRFSKVRIVNDSGRLHPMHLHGQFFRVLARNGLPAEERFWRDTVLVYPREIVEIGLVPVDKGAWATHCHILEHAEAGMMTLTEVE